MAKDNKTSKTARVMNLLSKKPDPALEEPAAEKPEEPPAPPVPPIVTTMAPDAAVSVQIKNALEDALEGELGTQEEDSQPASGAQGEFVPVQVAGPGEEPISAGPEPEAQPEPAAPAPVPTPEPVPEPVAEEPAPVVEEPPAPPAEEPPVLVDEPTVWKEPLEPVAPGYINVMQVLVEEKAPKYVKMFGLCDCKRCMEDVKAFTLNHLPPKYVVLEPGDRVPRLTVYEGKFSSDITAQLLQACKIVNKTPHHSRG